MDTEHKEVFSQVVHAGRRSYFFDVKLSSEGKKYLVISESFKEGNAFKHHRVMIFEEHLPEFAQALWQALHALSIPLPQENRIVQSEERFSRYSRAYQPWSAEEEVRLLAQFRAGVPVPQIAVAFQRTPGAIRSRLKKLGAV